MANHEFRHLNSNSVITVSDGLRKAYSKDPNYKYVGEQGRASSTKKEGK